MKLSAFRPRSGWLLAAGLAWAQPVWAQDAEPARFIVTGPRNWREISGLAAGLADADPNVRGEVVRIIADGEWARNHLPGLTPDMLTEQLASGRPPEIRRSAAIVTCQLAARQVEFCAPATALLADPDDSVRGLAVMQLASASGRQQYFETALAELLQSPRLEVRFAAANLKARWGDPSGLIALLRESGSLKTDVLLALAGMGRKAAPATEELMSIGPNRRGVLGALAAVGPIDECFHRSILSVLSRTDVDLNALANIAKSNSKMVDELRKRAAGFFQLPDNALFVLAAADGLTPELIELVGAVLTKSDVEQKREALIFLGSVGQPAWTQALAIRNLLADPDLQVRNHAAIALGHLGKGGLAAADDLQKLVLESPDRQLREHAAQALGQMARSDPAPLRLLVSLLGHREARVRGLAVIGIHRAGPIPAARFAPELARCAGEPDAKVAFNLLRLLSHFKAAAFVPSGGAATTAVIQRTTDAEVEMRVAAAAALGALGVASAVPVLEKMLSDPELPVVREAILALGTIGPDAAPLTDRLAGFLTGPEDLREAALKALRNGRLLGPSFVQSQLPRLAERKGFTDELLEALDAGFRQLAPEELRAAKIPLHRWLEQVPPAEKARLQARIYFWTGCVREDNK